MTLDLRSSELEQKFMREHVNTVEKHFSKISSKIYAYVSRLTNLRDTGDELAKSISAFSSKESYNQTLRLTLGEFSDVFSSIQEYRDAQANRIHAKIIHDLDSYGPVCKQTKAEIKKCFETRQKELKKKTDLEKTRSKHPANWQKISQAEREVNKAEEDATRSMKELSMQIERFERKKIEDLKKIFLEFIKIEMIFHAKAIELYTKSYNLVKEINVENDLEKFKSHFKASSLQCETSSHSQEILCKNNETNSQNEEMLSKHPVANAECADHSWKPQPSRSAHRKSRSVFTVKAAATNVENSSSSFESFIEQPKFDSGDGIRIPSA